jgi:hypothetical protein
MDGLWTRVSTVSHDVLGSRSHPEAIDGCLAARLAGYIKSIADSGERFARVMEVGFY